MRLFGIQASSMRSLTLQLTREGEGETSVAFHLNNPALIVAHILTATKTFALTAMDAIKTLESRLDSKIDASFLDHFMKELEGRVQSRIQKDKELALLKERTSELELQLQASLASTHDGSFLWHIPDFARRKRDAIEERVVSIYSPPFYTGRNGYKMCVRAYLNGDGKGYKTHLSLFFVLMTGEFDALLKWPFEEKVSFILVDQAHHKHIVQTFKPSIERPRLPPEMNIASGCPQFAKLSVLEDCNVVKDDVVFIKCVVDTSKIFHP